MAVTQKGREQLQNVFKAGFLNSPAAASDEPRP
jgi:hypothetical protein